MSNASVIITPTVGDSEITFKVAFTNGIDATASQIQSAKIYYTDSTSFHQNFTITGTNLTDLRTTNLTYVTITGLENYTPAYYKAEVLSNGKRIHSSAVSVTTIGTPEVVKINRDYSRPTGKESFVINIDKPLLNDIVCITANLSLAQRYTQGTPGTPVVPGGFSEVNTLFTKTFVYNTLTVLSDNTINLLFDGSADGIEEDSEYEVALFFGNSINDSPDGEIDGETGLKDNQIVIRTTNQCNKPTDISIVPVTLKTKFKSPNDASFTPVTGFRLERKFNSLFEPVNYEYYKFNADSSFTKLTTTETADLNSAGLPSALGTGFTMTNLADYQFAIVCPANNTKFTYRMRLLNTDSNLANTLKSGEIGVGAVSDEFDAVNMAEPTQVLDLIYEPNTVSITQPAGIADLLTPSLCKLTETNIKFKDPLGNWPIPGTTQESYRVATVSINSTKTALSCAIKVWFNSAGPVEKSDNTQEQVIASLSSTLTTLLIAPSLTIPPTATALNAAYTTWQASTKSTLAGSVAKANAIDEYFSVMRTAERCMTANSTLTITDTEETTKVWSLNTLATPKVIYAPAGSSVKVQIKAVANVTIGTETYTAESAITNVNFIPTSKISDIRIDFSAVAESNNIKIQFKPLYHAHAHNVSTYSLKIENRTISGPQTVYSVPIQRDNSSYEFTKPFIIDTKDLSPAFNVVNGNTFRIEAGGVVGAPADGYDTSTDRSIPYAAVNDILPAGKSSGPNFSITSFPRDQSLSMEIIPLTSSELNGSEFDQYNFYLVEDKSPNLYANVKTASQTVLQQIITNGQTANGYVASAILGVNQADTVSFGALTNGKSYYVIGKTISKNATASSDYNVSNTSLLCYGRPSTLNLTPILTQNNGVLTVSNIGAPTTDGVGLSNSRSNLRSIFVQLSVVQADGGEPEVDFIEILAASFPPSSTTPMSYTFTTAGLELGATYIARVFANSNKVNEVGVYLMSESTDSNYIRTQSSPVFGANPEILLPSSKSIKIPVALNGSVLTSGIILFTTDSAGDGDSEYIMQQADFDAYANGAYTVDLTASPKLAGSAKITGFIVILSTNNGQLIYKTLNL